MSTKHCECKDVPYARSPAFDTAGLPAGVDGVFLYVQHFRRAGKHHVEEATAERLAAFGYIVERMCDDRDGILQERWCSDCYEIDFGHDGGEIVPISLQRVDLANSVSQCGLFPGVAYVLTLWYCKADTQFRQALFFCAASMAGAFAGLLAVGLAKMDGVGDLEGFRWIFIIEGLLTVVVAIAAFFIVLDTPQSAKFLTAEEKASLLYRLEVDEFGADDDNDEKLTKEEQLQIHSRVPKGKLFKAVFSDWHIYAHILIFYGVSAPLYSISLCLPSIVQGLGYTATNANFLTVPIYITACGLSLGVAFWADRKNTRFPPLITSYCVMFVGFLIALVRPSKTPGVAYAGVFIAACGIYPAFPGMITWFCNNVASSGKRSIAMALHIGMGSFGGAMGPNFYRAKDAPVYRLGHGLNLLFVGMGILAQLAVFTSYKHINRKREKQCMEFRAELEKEVETLKSDEEKLHRRHRFRVEMEESLAHQGDRSVWFRYTI